MRLGVVGLGTGGPGSGPHVHLRHLLAHLGAEHPDIELDLVVAPGAEDGHALHPGGRLFPLRGAGRGAVRELIAGWREIPLLAGVRSWDLAYVAVDRRLPPSLPCPVVVTVHDLAAFHVRGRYGVLRGWFNRLVVPRLVTRADVVVASSRTTAEDLCTFTAVEPARIRVAPLGVDHDLFRPAPERRDTEVRRRHGLERPYLLYPARLEHPGKNHVGLLRAHRRLLDSGYTHELVLVGKPWRETERIHAEVQRLGIAEHVRFTGWIPDEDLPALLRGATALAFPSRYEGFGLPVLEAMACGTPVAHGGRGALSEVTGDAALRFDPEDPRSIAAVLGRLIEDAALRRTLAQAGTRRARDFRWETTARETVAAFEEALLRTREEAGLAGTAV